MKNLRVPLWAFAAIGIAGVFFLAQYVTSQFDQATAEEDQATYTGLYIDTTKPATVLSSSEQKKIDQWIKKHNLNTYGDPKDTVYKSGPLKKQGGDNNYTSRFQYILANHSDRPWNGEKTAEEKAIDAWISKNSLNQFGDSAFTNYAGGTPLYNETTGKILDRYDYIRQKHSDKPWDVATTTAAGATSP